MTVSVSVGLYIKSAKNSHVNIKTDYWTGFSRVNRYASEDQSAGGPSSGLILEDLVRALQDPAIIELRSNNNLHRSLAAAERHIEALEAYSMRPDIIISGLQMSSFAEAAALTDSQSTTQSSEHADATEAASIKLFNVALNIAVTRQDISSVHRLPKRRNDDMTPAPVLVRFTTLRTRDTIYRALQARPGLYINEHLTKSTTTLFHDARMFVKQKRLLSIWTTNGVMFVKASNYPSARQGGNYRRAAEDCFMNMHTHHLVLLLGHICLSFQVVIVLTLLKLLYS